MPIFGCIVDDFTDASDIVLFLVKGGTSVQLFSGIPVRESRTAGGIRAIVIALKSRTQDTGGVVADTMRSFGWLKEQDVEKFYLKYCSTFGSTLGGSIDPVADAVMEPPGVSYMVLCPVLPVSRRVVGNGELYVDGVPSHESPVKNHSLTPIWDSRIVGLMKPQSRYPCVELQGEQMDRPTNEIRAMFTEQEDGQECFYVIPDCRDMEDRKRIAELFRELALLTDGNGILESLAERLSNRQKVLPEPDIQTEGPAILLAGSCSEAILGQIDYFQTHGGLSYKMVVSYAHFRAHET